LGLPPIHDAAAIRRVAEADRLLKGFDPNQPRDDRGRWTSGVGILVIQYGTRSGGSGEGAVILVSDEDDARSSDAGRPYGSNFSTTAVRTGPDGRPCQYVRPPPSARRMLNRMGSTYPNGMPHDWQVSDEDDPNATAQLAKDKCSTAAAKPSIRA